MDTTDESTYIETEETQITSQNVIVNTGWTTPMALWNTLGTVAGALIGLVGLVLALVMYYNQLSTDRRIDNLEKSLVEYEKIQEFGKE